MQQIHFVSELYITFLLFNLSLSASSGNLINCYNKQIKSQSKTIFSAIFSL